MQTARVTVLMTPEKKAAVETRTSHLGVSASEYIRLAVDNYADGEEELLAHLVEELDAAVPAMAASLDRSIAILEESHRYVDGVLREMGASEHDRRRNPRHSENSDFAGAHRSAGSEQSQDRR